MMLVWSSAASFGSWAPRPAVSRKTAAAMRRRIIKNLTLEERITNYESRITGGAENENGSPLLSGRRPVILDSALVIPPGRAAGGTTARRTATAGAAGAAAGTRRTGVAEALLAAG